MLERLKIQSTFVDGLRVTDEAMVEVVEMVLAGRINKMIVSAINEAGGKAVGLSGKDGSLIRAKKLMRRARTSDSNIERFIDLGFVGEPVQVTPDMLEVFFGSDVIPVIAPIGFGEHGETFNINADTASGAVAAAIGATRLMLLTDVAGVKNADGDVIPKMSLSEAQHLVDNEIATGGMIPKLETCIKALRQGVEAAVVLDGRAPHAVLLELFTEHGAGTLWRPHGYLSPDRCAHDGLYVRHVGLELGPGKFVAQAILDGIWGDLAWPSPGPWTMPGDLHQKHP
jgi:acetylglutamate kinase